MKDTRNEKIKRHYSVQLNENNFKVLSHRIDTDASTLKISTKIFGQHFPCDEHVVFSVPEAPDKTITVAFRHRYRDEKIEQWVYAIAAP